MNTRRIALVTARAARGTDHDMAALLAALRAAGADARETDWDDATIDWTRFDVALLRSPWDYVDRLPAFLDWAARVAQDTCLLNPLPIVRWNTDKHYLAELARAGVAVVPTRMVEPGADVAPALDAVLAAHPDARDIVIKPAIGAGSRDARRHARAHHESMRQHAQRLLDAGRSVLLQPYLAHVDVEGETALVLFEGEFSHAVRKGALLERDAEATSALYAPETLRACAPETSQLDLARRVLAALPFAMPLLYARVDLIRADDGSPRLLELELVEPSVFLDYAEGAAARFAAAILRRAGVHLRAPPARLPSCGRR